MYMYIYQYMNSIDMKTEQEMKITMENEYREAMKKIESFMGIPKDIIEMNMKNGYTETEARELCLAANMLHLHEKKSYWKQKISEKYSDTCRDLPRESWEYMNEIGSKIQKEQEERHTKACKN